MKEFWLAILKNVITYVLMIIIVVCGGISIATQKFPPDWAKIVSAVNTIKDGYVSMINLRQSMGGGLPLGLGAQPQQQLPISQEMLEQLAAQQGSQQGPQGANKDKAQIEMETTLALLKSMSQQVSPQHALPQNHGPASDPEMKKNMLALIRQNQELIEKMEKIQTYLEKMHVYLTQTVPRQPAHYSAVQDAPPTRQIAKAPTDSAAPNSAVQVGTAPAPAASAPPAAPKAAQSAALVQIKNPNTSGNSLGVRPASVQALQDVKK